jgi:hypothetical protein
MKQRKSQLVFLMQIVLCWFEIYNRAVPPVDGLYAIKYYILYLRASRLLHFN